VLVLHGSNGSAAEMEPLTAALRAYVPDARAIDLLGHGGRPVPERFSTRAFAEDVVAWLDRERIDRTTVLGYSTGGYLALYLARHFPERIERAVALATKYVFDASSIAHWVHLAQPERLKLRGGPRLANLQRFHAPQSWEAVTLANARYFEDLGREPPLSDRDLGSIRPRVMLVSSDRDQLVPWKEMLDLRRLIPGCHLAMFYGGAHPIAAVPVMGVARAIGQWVAASQ